MTIMSGTTPTDRIRSFDFQPGREIARKYRVVSKLGAGWEGEVYKIIEIRTGIERAAKIFFPQRNVGNRTARRYARKLHKLRHCPILIQYHGEEIISWKRHPVTALVSEYIDGQLLSEFIARRPEKRLSPFEAIHLLHALVTGLEPVHQLNEYHGDLHTDNIIISRFGLNIELKVIDLFHLEGLKYQIRHEEIYDVIRLFYDALGGAPHYSRQPEPVKRICCGLKRSLIRQRFKSLAQLRKHLETMNW